MSSIKELAKHSGNYFLAILASKALAFISIPVYTYLLTVEEYGIYNLFISTVGIATVLLTLNSEVAISRYFYDAKDTDDFKIFVGTSINLTSMIFLIMSIITVLFCKPLSIYLNLDKLLILAIIPVSLYNVINSIFQQIYQPLLKSRKIAIVTSVQSYLAFGLSVIVMLFLKQDKYYGQVWGTIAAMFIIAYYLIRQIKPFYKRVISKVHIKYILSYSIPYLPYSLSGIIIAQFGKLVIGQEQGFESVGMYSFASNIATLMLVLISVTHSAWNPYYFQYMKNENYKQIDNDYELIWRLTILASVVLSLFSKEIAMILGRPEYLGALQIIPILVLGYCFYQWSYVYMRNVGYSKRTIWNAVVVVLSGIINVLLNYLLVDGWGDMGIATSFALSYLSMLLLGWVVNKYILKVYAPSVKKFILPFISLFPIICCAWFQFTSGSIWWDICAKLLVVIIYTIFLFHIWKDSILTFLNFKNIYHRVKY